MNNVLLRSKIKIFSNYFLLKPRKVNFTVDKKISACDKFYLTLSEGIEEIMKSYYFVVEPIAPILILLNLTVASGCWASTSEGTPDEVGQGPRAIPGLFGSASVG